MWLVIAGMGKGFCLRSVERRENLGGILGVGGSGKWLRSELLYLLLKIKGYGHVRPLSFIFG